VRLSNAADSQSRQIYRALLADQNGPVLAVGALQAAAGEDVAPPVGQVKEVRMIGVGASGGLFAMTDRRGLLAGPGRSADPGALRLGLRGRGVRAGRIR
jgi:hypothetical protein